MKKQILVIHGGDTYGDYESYLKFLREWPLDFKRMTSNESDWKRELRTELGDGYEVVLPSMPNKFDARYEEWKIWFEKLFPFLRDEVILVGHSMGGAFLCKYLTENVFPKKVKALFLVASVYDKDTDGNPLWTFALPETLKVPTDKIFLYHSKDDPVVPISDLDLYQKQFPDAKVRIFEDRGHFNQENFPEIVEDIRKIA